MMRHSKIRLSISISISISFVLVLFFLQQGQGANVQAHQTTELKSFIESLEVGDAIYYENLTIVPVYSRQKYPAIHYKTLDEALRSNLLEITEYDTGSVPRVKVSNLSRHYIYIMGGEIISGGKQDRIFARDVLMGPRHQDVVIPVYCTEQGRWDNKTDKFYSKQILGDARLRSTAQSAPAMAQDAIWGEIAESSRAFKVSSATRAYQEIYEKDEIRSKIMQHQRRLLDAPQLYHDTVGVVVGVGSRVISVDLFGNPSLFQRLWPKILKSSALSAMSQQGYGRIDQRDAIRVLSDLREARYVRNSAVDLGYELSAQARQWDINALLYEHAVLHVAAFPGDKAQIRFKGRPQDERRVPVIRR